MRTSILIFSLLLGLSCGRLDPQPKIEEEESFNSALKVYTMDKDTGGLFEKIEWYDYYSVQRALISVLDIYAIRSNNRYYKMQILDFYPDNNLEKPGFYTVRVDDGNGMQVLTFNAEGCGIPQSNPNFDTCVNSEDDVFTYLRLSDQTLFKMSDDKAKASLDWDIAFKFDVIKLNSGNSGPGSVVGALLSRERLYTSEDIEENERFNALFEAKAGDSDLGRFQANYDFINRRYFGPDGIDRVVYERFWFNESDGVRTAVPGNWWIIRLNEGAGYSKFNVSNITQESIDRDEVSSQITFQIHTQEVSDEFFPLLPQEFQINVKSSSRKILCIDLNGSPQVVNCRNNTSWDMRFINNRGDWSIETKAGALGPISQALVGTINSGRN